MVENFTINDRELFNLLLGRSGGKTTMNIINEILIQPRNANQLSNILHIDYKTVIYHMKILCKHDYVIREKFDNFYWYQPSEKLINNLDEYNFIKQNMD
ncbi:winged helix-turn-helix domain-containing protein [Methanobrevibacter sp.]|uniref:winged helix-turn-helix domain-containing protein n=1 Tax=Methanobrevibacter sp. TaxID=66852 RepID=UPI00388ED472